MAYRQLSAIVNMGLKRPVSDRLLTRQSPPHAILDVRRRYCTVKIMLIIDQCCGVCSLFLEGSCPLPVVCMQVVAQ